AGVAAVVVALGQRRPPLGLLTDDVRFGRLALGVERVELLVEPLIAGLAGVDGAAGARFLLGRLGGSVGSTGSHRCTPRRKKRKPLMWVRVIRLATAVRVR